MTDRDVSLEREFNPALPFHLWTPPGDATPAPATTPPPPLSLEEAQRAALAERLRLFSEAVVYAQSALAREDLATLRSMLDEHVALREVVRRLVLVSELNLPRDDPELLKRIATLLAPYVGTDPGLRAFCDEWFPEGAAR